MKKKWKIILGLLLAVLIAGYWASESFKPLTAQVLEVQPGTISLSFKEEGKVVPAKERPIHAIHGGRIEQILVEEGQPVREGDVLAVLDTREIDYQLQELAAQLKSVRGEKAGKLQEPYEIQLRSQELLVEQAERELAQYQTNFARIERLYEANAVTEAAYEEAKKMLEQAQTRLELEKQALALLRESTGPGSGTQQFYEGRIEALQAQLSFLEYQKSQSRITAPISGIVSELGIKEGELANPAVPLMKIFDPSSYAIETYVLTSDIRGIKEGMEVDVILDGRGEDVAYRGIVKNIAPSAVSMISALGLEEQRVKVTVALEDAAAAELFPGCAVDVAFTVDERRDVLVVPRTALFPYGDGEAVWVVEDGKAQVRPVQTGFYNNRDIVITEGLEPGDLVIVDPQLKGLDSGKRIKVQK